ncbi:MAG: helix-turn-helix domain-containing protein [Pseudomonadales bacterium]|nr:helix-turn-helix domain-containing protein [Pseudomonadales bacterium]
MHESELDLVFKALAHAERRRILFSLYDKPKQSLFEVCAESFGRDGKTLSRQTISQHLDALERAGLLEVTWQGRTKMHSITEKPLRRAMKILSNNLS